MGRSLDFILRMIIEIYWKVWTGTFHTLAAKWLFFFLIENPILVSDVGLVLPQALSWLFYWNALPYYFPVSKSDERFLDIIHRAAFDAFFAPLVLRHPGFLLFTGFSSLLDPSPLSSVWESIPFPSNTPLLGDLIQSSLPVLNRLLVTSFRSTWPPLGCLAFQL